MLVTMALSESLRTQLSELVTANRVVLFMKGTRHMPQCGFSAQVVKLLNELGAGYETVDVLRSPEIRDGIKEFSQWPTIPQLYVAGQFVGGCDIVRDMHAAGELQKMIGGAGSATITPTLAVTEAARGAFQGYLAEAKGDSLRLHIDGQFQHDLFLGPPEPGDVVVEANGVALALDPSSARRAQGVNIDFVDGPSAGFKIHNPNEPPRVKSLTPKELQSMLDRGDEIHLFDVRTLEERAIAKLARARHLDDEGQSVLLALDRSAPIAFHCHHGMRSRAAAERALQEGFKNVYNVEGGIDAWSQTVDPSVPRY
jgi:monothiol glutaredoxin